MNDWTAYTIRAILYVVAIFALDWAAETFPGQALLFALLSSIPLVLLIIDTMIHISHMKRR